MADAPFQREPALRVFAQEFRDSRVQIDGEGERDPNYVITPAGAKINRMHVVGVCTDVEPVGEQGDVWRARISDPTGVFTVYAGQYQPEAAAALSEIEPPAFVAVTGKARTYEPEAGSIFVSIRPENIHGVNKEDRDQWILDTARRTKERVEAGLKARADGNPSDVEGVALAQTHYGLDGIEKYLDTAKLALEGLLPGGEVQVHRIEASEDDGGFTGQGGNDAPTWTPPPTAKPEEANPEEEALDESIFATVERLQGSDGAKWDDILGAANGDGATAEDVEESLNRLMDKGLVYEPTLGVLKTT